MQSSVDVGASVDRIQVSRHIGLDAANVHIRIQDSDVPHSFVEKEIFGAALLPSGDRPQNVQLSRK
jgi:hypothetical protein